MMTSSRRDFLKASGSLIIGLALPGQALSAASGSDLSGKAQAGAWLQLNSDGSIALFPGKVEIGQGIGTAIAQVVAEELRVDINRIKLMPVDTDHSPNQFYTFGSISVQQSRPPARKAASAAYHFLLDKAAERLSLSGDVLTARNGEIFAQDVSTELTFWQILENENFVIDPDQANNFVAISDYQTVGTSAKRLDIPGKVFGKESYIQDLRLPNMVHARLIRPPAPRATLEHMDSKPLESMDGFIRLIRDGNFLAVVTKREGQARNIALSAKNLATWSLPGDLPSTENQYQWLRTTETRDDTVFEKESKETSSTKTVLSATYQRPYHCHASISPSAAVALNEAGHLTVWTHSQGVYPLREAIAEILGLETNKVRCIHAEASGCYGHNGSDDAACEAAAIAMQMPGIPIRLQWERSDEFLWEPYGPAMEVEVSAAIDTDARISDWTYDVWSCTHSSRPRSAKAAGNLLFAQHCKNPLPIPEASSIPQPNGGDDRNAVPLYNFNGTKVTKHLAKEIPLRTSALRGLGAYTNVFAIESFMDELALKVDQDPMDFRLNHLNDPRAIELLKKLAEVSGWYKRPEPGQGEGWGIGFAQYKNSSSYGGIVTKLNFDKGTGDISLKHITAVCDAGLIINPDGVKSQIEGGIIQSASWTLKEQVKFDHQQVLSHDWLSYPILRFNEIPEVEVHLMSNDKLKPLGVAETSQGPTVPSIANALYHASGLRVRQLPLTPERLKA